ncbi:uncharacterized protein LOC103177496 isoform X2 [Callorhinchus milii]|uniref:uncharacterized protein LOC103177496 isoform X2 n=1 Tax=Callorhinchus milii TaxID=7868 RepID=UPI001C3FC663|nr:uncharacterized protein LOC103177496 isoform X2 [Callorhinchus milii]XP_042190272.1 uncharacterized protein LOC103177496 isoform X2 [Callorhinchus milii]
MHRMSLTLIPWSLQETCNKSAFLSEAMFYLLAQHKRTDGVEASTVIVTGQKDEKYQHLSIMCLKRTPGTLEITHNMKKMETMFMITILTMSVPVKRPKGLMLQINRGLWWRFLITARVTEMQQGRGKPMFFEPRVMTVSYGNTHQMPLNQMRNQKPVEREVRIRMPPPDLGSRSSPVRIRVQKEPMKVTIPAKGVHSTSQAQSLYTCRARRSPPLPTIHSVQSLKEPTMQYSPATGMPDFTQGNTILVQDSRVHVSSGTNDIVSSTARHYPDGSFLQETLDNINTLNDPRRQNSFSKAEELPSSSSAASMSFEYLGDLSRNVRVPAAFLMKARQKTKPKYVARYLIRTMFPKETLMYSNMQGDRARAIKPLDSNKIAALREFLCMLFPTYDLSEQGKDWKICVSNVNSMIRSLRCEIRRGAVSSVNKE